VQKEFPEKFGSDIDSDQQLILEGCDKGPCLKEVKTENLPKL